MPTIEAQLWYVWKMQSASWAVGVAKNITIFASLSTLCLEVGVTGSLLDTIAFLPILVLMAVVVIVRRTLDRMCKDHLGDEIEVLVKDLEDGTQKSGVYSVEEGSLSV